MTIPLVEITTLIGQFILIAYGYLAIGVVSMLVLNRLDYQPQTELGAALFMIAFLVLWLPSLVFMCDLLEQVDKRYPRLANWIDKRLELYEEGDTEVMN